MKQPHLMRLLWASTLLTAAIPGFGQAPAPTEAVTITGTRIALPAQPHRMRGSEFDALRGQYDLSNGKTLSVSGSARRMLAEIEGMPRAELVAASGTELVGKQRDMRLSFDQRANGLVDGVTVTYLQPLEAKGRRRGP